jgi:hypothetical protein
MIWGAFQARKEDFMRAFLAGSAALVLFLTASSLCNAQILKKEPEPGQLTTGTVVLVDDGTCGKGKIKQVTGGSTSVMTPKPRIRKCIQK